MRHSALATALVAGASLALTACGSDDSETATGEPVASPAAAVAAVEGTSAELDRASTALKAGDRAAALEAVKEAYVSNFEDAEAALEDADAELNEALEDGIGKDLLADFKSGATTAELRATIADLQRQLETAKATLQP